MEDESEDMGEEMPSIVENIELAKIMKEHMAKTRKMEEKIRKLEELRDINRKVDESNQEI